MNPPGPVSALRSAFRWRTWIAALPVGAVIGAAAWVVVRPDLMQVAHVRFEGAHRASEVELRHLVDVRNGVTVWRVDAQGAARGAARHPWVRHAEARVEFPDSLVIAVQERQPLAMVMLDDGLFYVDADGTPFARATTDDLDHPVITGVSAAVEASHPDVPGAVVRGALERLDRLATRGLLTPEAVSEIRFSDTLGFTVFTTSGAQVMLGLEGLERRLDRLAAVLDRGVSLDTPVRIDLAPETVAIVQPLTPPGES